MATKTVVCPECGSAAAPGRYACSDCGALLAAVAPAPRVAIVEPDEQMGEPDALADVDATALVGAALVGAALNGAALNGAALNGAALNGARKNGARKNGATKDGDAPDGAVPATAPVGTQATAPVAPSGSGRESVGVATDLPDDTAGEAEGEEVPMGPSGLAFDEDAPLAAARRTVEAAVIEDLPDPRREVAWPDPADAFSVVTAAPAATAPSTAATRSWPPADDRGPLAAPEPRTPAGAYLPPSAVLPPLDLPAGTAAGAAPGSGVAGSASGPAGAARSGSPASDVAGQAAAALSAGLRTIRVASDAARRAVAVGAGLAAIGLLLPWVNTLPGASPIADYLDRWGLAGPGMWLVLLAVVVLGGVAASSGTPASWPVRLPAVAIAAFLVGLVWPYAVGASGRSIGVWVVLVGSIVLGVAGLFASRGRNEDATSSV